jgi:hypothetical protein
MDPSEKIELAPQDEIDLYESIARPFLHEILEVDLSECLITDESNLSDFAWCGYPESESGDDDTVDEPDSVWDVWVVAKVCDKYQIEPFETSIRLVELFRRIEARSQIH